MSSERALRGSCACGRNQYVVQIPKDFPPQDAEVRLSTERGHRISSAAPLSAMIRVPLSWLDSRAFAFYPDESRADIRRFYSHPSEPFAKRHFCGYCGTPLSYWSEEPRGEAEYIQLTLGSLLTQDLHDLEDLGFRGLGSEGSDTEDAMDVELASPPGMQMIGRELTSVPWFETLVQGSRLGSLHTAKGTQQSRDGTVRVEFEISEWTADDDDELAAAESSASSTTGKRKRGASDTAAAASAP